MVDEFDRAGVVAAAAVAKHAAERVVELVDVGAIETAVVGDVPFEFGRHLVWRGSGRSHRKRATR